MTFSVMKDFKRPAKAGEKTSPFLNVLLFIVRVMCVRIKDGASSLVVWEQFVVR